MIEIVLLFTGIVYSCPTLNCGLTPDCPAGQLLDVSLDSNGCAATCPTCRIPSTSCPFVACPLLAIFCDPSSGLVSVTTHNFDSQGCPGCPIQRCVNATSVCPALGCPAVPISCTSAADVIVQANVDMNGCATTCASCMTPTSNNCPSYTTQCPIGLPLCAASAGLMPLTTWTLDANGCKMCASTRCIPLMSTTTTTPTSTNTCVPRPCAFPSCENGVMPVSGVDGNGCPTCPTCPLCPAIACLAPSTCPNGSIPVAGVDANGCRTCPQCQSSMTPPSTMTCIARACAYPLCANGAMAMSGVDANGCSTCPTCPTCPEINCPAAPSTCPDGSMPVSGVDSSGCPTCPQCPSSTVPSTTTCLALPCAYPSCPNGVMPVSGTDANGCATCPQCPSPTCPPAGACNVLCVVGTVATPQFDANGCQTGCNCLSTTTPSPPTTACPQFRCLVPSCASGQSLVSPAADANGCVPGCPSCQATTAPIACPQIACQNAPCSPGFRLVPGGRDSNGCPQCGVCEPFLTAEAMTGDAAAWGVSTVVVLVATAVFAH